MSVDNFKTAIQQGYSLKGAGLLLGAAKYQNEVLFDCPVQIPLSTLNRHGLIAGATGTGKTKTIQIIAECMSDAGIPVLLMDIKGDLSGLAAPGNNNAKIAERYQLLHLDYQPQPYPVELLTISKEKGTPMRATVTEFGPVLLSKVLDLNATQSSIVSVLFKYCDDKGLPIIDLKDFIKVLQFASEEGKADIEKAYGKIATTSLGTILRKVIELQQQGADDFFGELSFDPYDLMRNNDKGNGMINIMRVVDLQNRPKLFSTFMLQLLAELYATLPEAGDEAKPKLCLFIDEAHLIFDGSSKELVDQLETVVKLIRSKGVGVFFCTQNPQDIPAAVLSQLGLKVQHALRAFTAIDRKNIKLTAQNYPLSDFYNADELLTSLGIGEAIITSLNEKGIPTPLVHTFLTSPKSRMDILNDTEIDEVVRQSRIHAKYAQIIDRESAYEILSKRVNMNSDEDAGTSKPKTTSQRSTKAEKSWMDKALNSSAGKQAQRSLTRTLFGVLEKAAKSFLSKK